MTLPIIEQIREMTNAQRCAWLHQCPFGILILHRAEIEKAMRAAQFDAGLRCLEAELALLASVRAEDGRFRPGPLLSAHAARSDMREAVKHSDRAMKTKPAKGGNAQDEHRTP